MRAKAVLLGLVALVSLAGCFHHSYTVGAGAPNGRVVYSKWHSHWLFAIIGEDNVDVKSVCPSGNATVRNDVTFVNGLIGVLIGIIYYPTTVEVFCAEGPSAAAPDSAPLEDRSRPIFADRQRRPRRASVVRDAPGPGRTSRSAGPHGL